MPDGWTSPLNRSVFLSYASADRDAARRICDALRSVGVGVWFDQEGGLEHGDEWDAKIRRQIKECLLFIPLISANTQARLEGYFRIEWDLAADRAQGIAQGVPFILPITIDAIREPEALVPDRFRKVQWMLLPGGNVTPDVLGHLVKLWAIRTSTLPPESARDVYAGAASGPGVMPAPAAVGADIRARSEVGGRRAAPPPRPASPAPAPVAKPVAPAAAPSFPPPPPGRFGSLEFGGGPARESRPEIVKDEGYYLAEARDNWQRGRYELALRSYSKVLEYNATNEEAWTGQVRMMIDLSELREAKLWVDKALQHFPNLPDLLAAKAVVLARMADFDGALALSDAAIEERGNTPYVWLARGDVLLARGEARASYCFEQALTLARGDWLHLWQASRIHTFHRSFALAQRYAQQAVELAPARAVVWLQAGENEIALGQGERARESLQQAGLIDPECPGLDRARQAADNLSAGTSLWRRLKKVFL